MLEGFPVLFIFVGQFTCGQPWLLCAISVLLVRSSGRSLAWDLLALQFIASFVPLVRVSQHFFLSRFVDLFGSRRGARCVTP
jgi:hypothetical protein